MASFEIVETSDTEERELLRSEDADYWKQATLAVVDHWQCGLLNRLNHAGDSLYSNPPRTPDRTPLSMRSVGQGDDQGYDSPSPRKRRKLAPAFPLEDAPTAHLSSPRSATVYDDSRPASPSRDVENPQADCHGSQVPEEDEGRSPVISQDTLTAEQDPGGNMASTVKSLPSSPSKSRVHTFQDGGDHVTKEDVGGEQVLFSFPLLSVREPSSSPDPLNLSTPPQLRHADQGERAKTPNILGSSRNHHHSSDSPLFTPRSSRNIQPSSPLTPLAAKSIMVESQSSPATHSNARRTMDMAPQASTSRLAANEQSRPDIQTAENQHQFVRYSLRARQAKQLNPYAYDQAYYKQLMRRNPDAIVKVVSPEHEKRHHRHHSHHEHDSDRPRRARSRSRDLSPSHSKSRLRKSMEPEAIRNRKSRSPPRLEKAVEKSKPKWYPKLLEEGLGSDEDDMVLQGQISPPPPRRLEGRIGCKEGDDRTRGSHSMKPAAPWFLNLPSPPGRLGSPSSGLSATDGPIERDMEHSGSMDFGPIPFPSHNPSPARGVRGESSDSEPSASSTSEEISKEDQKRLRILRRMMPAAMINRTLKKGQQGPRRRSVRSSDDEGDALSSAAVLPGQSRRRIVHNGANVRAEIVGDSESSDAESVLKSSDDEAGVQSAEHAPRPLHPPQEGFASDEERHSQVENFGEDSLDEGEIDSWLSHTAMRPQTTRPRRREGDLIDWMLTKTRHYGGKRHRKRDGTGGGRPRQSSRPRLNVVAAGARKFGDGHQTLLTFGRQQNVDRDSSPRYRSGEPFEEAREHGPGNVHQITERDASHAAERRKWKRKKARKPKAYVLSNPGIRTSSGKRQTHFITVDLEDEDFRQALAPRKTPEGGPTGGRKHRVGSRTYGNPDTPIEIESDDDAQPMRRLVRHRTPDHSDKLLRDIKSDCNIPFLPSGVAFGPETYIGRGWLHELTLVVSQGHEIPRPIAYTAHGIVLEPTMTMEEFSKIFPDICDVCFVQATTPVEGEEPDEIKRWEFSMHVACQLLSWLASRNTARDQENTFIADIRPQITRLVQRLEESLMLLANCTKKPHFWAAYWFAIEANIRLTFSSQPDTVDLHSLLELASRLVGHLRGYGLQQTIDSVTTLEKPLDDGDASVRTAELWICLFHVCESIVANNLGRSVSHPYCRIVMQAIQAGNDNLHSDLESSEDAWKAIFTMSALSQFSMHGMTTSMPRLPAAWELVEYALKRIRLTADPDSTQGLSRRSLSKRDGYIRLVVSRCFVLWKKWRWRLDGAMAIFNHLVEIFKSRKFTNLLDERPDFPNFLRRADVRLLSECTSGDTAFSVFLKLIVQTAGDLRNPVGQGNTDPSAPRLKKLLSMAVPVGSVPFTKATPPMGQELSMLYNRYSAIAIAIYLDPSPANVRFRLSHAQRYVIFKDTDFATRMACIRGVMHLAMLIRHLKLPMDIINNWLGEITNVLVDECAGTGAAGQSSDNRNHVLLTIQLLLGSIRRIIETPCMDPSNVETTYPDPGLLEGPWVTRVFAASTNLANVPTTGLEIRKLVQAFLDARAAAMPMPRIKGPAAANVAPADEDSQDIYGDLDLDLDDPELLAALGEDVEDTRLKEMKAKDEVVCKVMDQHISPAIYRLVCKNINDSSAEFPSEEHWADIDKWINCWVGCANVIVQNGRREWSHYLALGPQSWERIIEAAWRRRVGLRFMYMVLRSDPRAYHDYQDRFLEVFFESLVAREVSIENQYIALLLTVDGLHHPLLRGVPWDLNGEAELSKLEFLSGRLAFIEAVFINLVRVFREDHDVQTRGQNQSNTELITSMLAAMQDSYERQNEQSDLHEVYADFCGAVLRLLASHPVLSEHQRLSPFLDWAHKIGLVH
ncbi:hypothetical protein GLOTRDRAFT_138160 [Gloeophyllum trabeum ATCC 11539]|uniref:Uncharacterized protein n=1 Tax=Gloeophyllum trabeum (strain ATCC 11539 / FP-39264 / Madison 617) TaxID=670483 RepID=S7QA84_GLOTA|nr:uncharacterized protein GLOTRDRAFT_138160 [Gloeophyllum trabeum ATCC 11539]EPQ56427.1 hypothetical protein GLOTRDRAFT_138160 [Gloeophyllum trabeum ATCC 11539]